MGSALDAKEKRNKGRRSAPARKLKVFQASLGFYDTVIAVPSQAAALRAWGTHQNLFKDGVARPAEDEKVVKAALARPGVVLRRALGTNEPFGLEPGMPRIPDVPHSRKRAAKIKTEATPARAAPADRTALDRAEAELARLEEKRREEEAAFEARRRELEAEEQKASARFDKARDQARARVERERHAFVEVGGRLKP
jgi:hypothetical protein